MTLAPARLHRRLGPLGGATLSITISNLAARSLGLLVSFAAAAILEPARLGEFALLTVTAAFLGSVGVLGFGPLATRAIASADSIESAKAVATFVLSLCSGLLTVLGLGLCLLASPSIGVVSLPAAHTRGALITLAIWGFVVGINPLLVAIAAGHQAFSVCSVANVARAAVVGGGTTIGCIVGRSALDAAIGAAAAESLVALAVSARLWRSGWLSVGSGPMVVNRPHLVRQAVVSGAASLAIQFSMWAGQVVLSRSDDGLVANGAFLLASRLVLAVTLIPNALAMTGLPMLSDQKQPAVMRQRARQRIISYSFASAIPMAALMAVTAIVVLPAINVEYLAYRSTVTVMAVVGVAMSANNVLGSVAVAERRMRAWILSDWLLAATLLVVALVSVPVIGAAGLALSYLGAYAASVVLLMLDRRVDYRIV